MTRTCSERTMYPSAKGRDTADGMSRTGCPSKQGYCVGTNASLIPNLMTPIGTPSVLALETWMLTHSIRISVAPAKWCFNNSPGLVRFDGGYMDRSQLADGGWSQ